MSPAALAQFGSAENVDLLRQLKLRKTEAVAQLYEKYGTLLFRLINKVVPDRCAAETILAEIFLLACNRVQDLPDTSINLGAWLLILARNHLVRHQSCSTNRGQPGSNLEAPVLFHSDTCMTGFDRFPQLCEAFLNLPEPVQAGLELAWCEGLSFKEISDKLEQPTTAIKAAISEGVTRIQKFSPA